MISDDDLHRLSCLHFIVDNSRLPDGCDCVRLYNEGLIWPIPTGWRLTALGEKTMLEWERSAQGLAVWHGYLNSVVADAAQSKSLKRHNAK